MTPADTDKGRQEPRAMGAMLRGALLYESHGEVSDLPERAADLIEAQQAEIARLREAMQPFAEAADCLDNPDPDRMEIWEHSSAMCITAGDLRKAKRCVRASLLTPNAASDGEMR